MLPFQKSSENVYSTLYKITIEKYDSNLMVIFMVINPISDQWMLRFNFFFRFEFNIVKLPIEHNIEIVDKIFIRLYFCEQKNVSFSNYPDPKRVKLDKKQKNLPSRPFQKKGIWIIIDILILYELS